MGVRSPGVVLYGNVAIPRVKCPRCRRMSLVVDMETLCCEVHIKKESIGDKVYRESEPPPQKRKGPSPKEKKRILEEQDYRCAYCDVAFSVLVGVTWDHFVPWSYAQDERTSNFIASCSRCNQLKQAQIFTGIEEVRVYIASRRSSA